ncbi:MAG: aminopeptidase P family protein [Roseburia sp.]|nr:aminopeptidase P family protein [Roseburia sp.]
MAEEKIVIQERLTRLRQVMAEKEIAYYIIPTADFHASEYVNDYFKVREYFCGFTGSNGTLLVWREGAGLWTDGRYFIQAEKELAGTGVTLYRMQEEGVPTIEEFLEERMEEGQSLGFDGRVISVKAGRSFEKRLAKKRIRFVWEQDLAEEIWKDRAKFPVSKVFVIPQELSGMSVADKLAGVRSVLREREADALFLTKLDDIMWLYNIRGGDVACNPVAMSYTYVSDTEAVLFIQKEAISNEVSGYLEETGIRIVEYQEVFRWLKGLPANQKILLDERYAGMAVYELLHARHKIIMGKNPTEALKAVKNPVELAHMREIYLKDSIAVTRFIYWLKKNIGRRELTEVSAAEYLDNLRRKIPEFLEVSFPTISAYGANAAMMHYEATPESHAALRPEGMLLVDSGGQYRGGTTDVTRTIVLGPLTEEEKLHYTVTVMGMLQLSHGKFLHGCTGRNLDILARRPIWDLGLDYRCGTGHGIGYILNVHEGPHSLRWRYNKEAEETVFQEGMVVTNEPGIYQEGSHGVRIENVMAVKNAEKTEYGQFLEFETLTWVPLDKAGIDERYLTEEGRAYLAAYQREVFDRLSPYLTDEERRWLREETVAE